MINDESRRKLREMNLGEIISGLETQQAEPATLGLPFDDRMQRLVDYVYQEKYNAKIQRLIRSAKLRFPQADMQGILYEGRGLNRELLGNLLNCQYIDTHQSIVLQGFTGSGKTYLACALGGNRRASTSSEPFISAFLTCSWNTVTVLPSQAARRSC